MDKIKIYHNSMTYSLLGKDLATQSLAHAYLIIQPDDGLRAEYARYFVMQLFCTKHNVCGECDSCVRIEHNNLPDLKIYPKSDKLTVEESRSIVGDNIVRPFEKDYKVYVINDIDRANPQSQNALLKVLEEPAESSIFLLTASSENGVLKTIESRSKKIIEAPLSSGAIRQYVTDNHNDISAELLDNITIIAGGRLDIANKLAGNNKSKAMIEDVTNVINNLSSSAQVLQYSAILIKYKNDLEEMLDTFLQLYLARMEDWAAGKDAKVNTAAVVMISSLITDCKAKNKFNCNPNGIIDHLLFGILEAKYICR